MTLAHPVNLQRAQDEAVGHAWRNLVAAVEGREDTSVAVVASSRGTSTVTITDWTPGVDDRRTITEQLPSLTLALDTARDRLNRDDWKDHS